MHKQDTALRGRALAASTPLFSALLNYRYSQEPKSQGSE